MNQYILSFTTYFEDTFIFYWYLANAFSKIRLFFLILTLAIAIKIIIQNIKKNEIYSLLMNRLAS